MFKSRAVAAGGAVTLPLLSVPYALKAADTRTLGGLPPSAFALAPPSASASGAGIQPAATTAKGTVTSVGLSAPVSDFTVSGSPVTTSGMLELNWSVAPTNADTASAIVNRHAHGSFTAGAITANLGRRDNNCLGQRRRGHQQPGRHDSLWRGQHRRGRLGSEFRHGRYAGLRGQKLRNEIIRVGVLQFFIAARFVNLAVSLPQYQFASHRHRVTHHCVRYDVYFVLTVSINASSSERICAAGLWGVPSAVKTSCSSVDSFDFRLCSSLSFSRMSVGKLRRLASEKRTPQSLLKT